MTAREGQEKALLALNAALVAIAEAARFDPPEGASWPLTFTGRYYPPHLDRRITFSTERDREVTVVRVTITGREKKHAVPDPLTRGGYVPVNSAGGPPPGDPLLAR
jgi:hypothetical protein